MEKPSKTTKKDRLKFICFGVLIVAIITATVLLWPQFMKLTDDASREAFVESVRSKGALGILILLGLQLLQVVVAFIPGEAVELIAGVLYGPWGGYLVCTIGVLLSSALIFMIVRQLGTDFVRSVIPQEKLDKMKFMQDSRRLDTIVFILFFIPGTPKDFLTYLVPLTDMKMSRFLIISSLARIPSIISSTYLGDSLYTGSFTQAVVIFAITGILGLAGILLNDKIITLLRKKEKNLVK